MAFVVHVQSCRAVLAVPAGDACDAISPRVQRRPADAVHAKGHIATLLFWYPGIRLQSVRNAAVGRRKGPIGFDSADVIQTATCGIGAQGVRFLSRVMVRG